MGALILTGTRAAGKTTLARQLLLRDLRLAPVPAVTTRAPRDDDQAGAYSYLSRDQFGQLEDDGALIISTSYAGERYGVTRQALAAAELTGNAPLLIITPESAAEMLSRDPGAVTLAVFVDANDAVLDDRLTQRSGPVSGAVMDQRVRDRLHQAPRMRVLQNESHLGEAVDTVARWWQAACAVGPHEHGS